MAMFRSPASLRTGLAAVIILVVVALLPHWLSSFNLGRADTVCYFAIGVLSMNLVTGMTGQISLGQAAFYGVGAYGVALLVQVGWPYWAAIPASAALAGVSGVLVGIPAARIRGLYLAVTTLAVGLAFPELIQQFQGATGGSNGAIITRYLTPPGWWKQPTANWVFYLTALLTAVCVLVMLNIKRSSLGRSMIAVRDHETVAELFGSRLTRIKITAFGLSAALAGLAGALLACQEEFVAPGDFTLTTSLYFFVGMAVGGAVSIWGAFVGALLIEFASSVISSAGVPQWATPIVYGGLLIVIVYFMPDGVGGAVRAGLHRLTHPPSADQSLIPDPSPGQPPPMAGSIRSS